MTVADKFFQARFITKKQTINAYEHTFKKYCNFHSTSLDELLEEAEKDEMSSLPVKYRSIKQRLQSFQVYLSKNYKYNTVKVEMSRIKTFYRTNEIELPYLPPLKSVPTINTTFEEIITKDDIKYAFEHTNNKKLKALILFMCSSGTAINEATKITIQQFIEATQDYHNATNIAEVIQVLKKQDDVIPTFFMIREKKERPYYTFCSPEAVRYILIYLEDRLFKKGINNNELLFPYTVPGAIATLIRLNDDCNFPRKKNGYRKFHSHGFRKFYATNMQEAGMNKFDIDFLCGRKSDMVTEAYFQIRPNSRKQRYKRYLKAVIVFDEVHYLDISSQEKKHYEKLKEEINKNKKENEQIKQMLYDLQKLL